MQAARPRHVTRVGEHRGEKGVERAVLRVGALAIAEEQLPRVVALLDAPASDGRAGGPGAAQELIRRAAQPLVVQGSGEVADVARAFNLVLAAVLRAAGEQAALRSTVSTIFLAVARRLQKQNERVMASLDELERADPPPEQLTRFYALDHEATLIRRLIASLKVLAGDRAGEPRADAVSLNDVVRAALGGVGDYQRVEDPDVDLGVWIDPDAVEDLTHLLTELLDNAVQFSAHSVRVTGRPVGDLLHLQVADAGAGIGAGQLADLQGRLDEFRMDAETARHMGLTVIGRIARRRGVTVRLRPAQAGTVVDVTVPTALFTVHPGMLPAAQAAEADRSAKHRPGTPLVPAAVEAPALRRQLVEASTQAMPVVGDATRELPRVPGSPPQWPMQASPPLQIFDQVAAANPWFGGAGDQQDTAPIPEQWRRASAAVAAADTAIAALSAGSGEPGTTTANGLPVRRPGQFAVPTLSDLTAPVIPAQRDHAFKARKIDSFGAAIRAARSR